MCNFLIIGVHCSREEKKHSVCVFNTTDLMTHNGRVKQAELNAESFQFGEKNNLSDSTLLASPQTRLAHTSVFLPEMLHVSGAVSPTHVVFLLDILQSVVLTLS